MLQAHLHPNSLPSRNVKNTWLPNLCRAGGSVIPGGAQLSLKEGQLFLTAKNKQIPCFSYFFVPDPRALSNQAPPAWVRAVDTWDSKPSVILVYGAKQSCPHACPSRECARGRHGAPSQQNSRISHHVAAGAQLSCLCHCLRAPRPQDSPSCRAGLPVGKE